MLFHHLDLLYYKFHFQFHLTKCIGNTNKVTTYLLYNQSKQRMSLHQHLQLNFQCNSSQVFRKFIQLYNCLQSMAKLHTFHNLSPQFFNKIHQISILMLFSILNQDMGSELRYNCAQSNLLNHLNSYLYNLSLYNQYNSIL